MTARQEFSKDEARENGQQIGIDWATAPFDVEQFRSGLDVELEHGLHDLLTNVTDDDPLVTARLRSPTYSSFPTTTRDSSNWRSRRSATTALHESSRRLSGPTTPLGIWATNSSPAGERLS